MFVASIDEQKSADPPPLIFGDMRVGFGHTRYVIFLNGGSQTRRDAREHYHELYGDRYQVVSNAMTRDRQAEHSGAETV